MTGLAIIAMTIAYLVICALALLWARHHRDDLAGRYSADVGPDGGKTREDA